MCSRGDGEWSLLGILNTPESLTFLVDAQIVDQKLGCVNFFNILFRALRETSN